MKFFLPLAACILAVVPGRAQEPPAPHVGLRVSAYLTQSIVTNRGNITGLGSGGYAFRNRPGILGDVLVDYKPRGRDGRFTFSTGLGLWWWSYRVGLRRDAVPSEVYYIATEGQGAIALQVPLRVSYRLHEAVDLTAGIAATSHLDGNGSWQAGGGAFTAGGTSIESFSSGSSRTYTSLTGDVLLTFRASRRVSFSLRGTMDSKAFAPVSITSTVTTGGVSRSYSYSGAPRMFFYSVGTSCAIF